MNSLILYPLLILILIGGFNQLINISYVDYTYEGTLTDIPVGGNQTLNGTEQELEQEQADAIFDIDMTTGLIILIIGLVAVGVSSGVSILGSGLNSYSVQLLHKSSAYYGIWGIFSVLAFSVFLSIPTFGLMMWLALTLIYTLGFFEELK